MWPRAAAAASSAAGAFADVDAGPAALTPTPPPPLTDVSSVPTAGLVKGRASSMNTKGST